MPHTIDFAVYCPWEFTAVIVVFALKMIGAFGSTSPPLNPLTLSFVSSKKNTRNEVHDEEEGMKKMGNKWADRKILLNVKALISLLLISRSFSNTFIHSALPLVLTSL
jgi:hypothetical protein